LEETSIEARDFTPGVAQRLYEDLKERCPVFTELATLVEYVESHIG
jgi:hypothetical protein